LVLGILLVLVLAPGKKPLYALIVVLTGIGLLRGYTIFEDSSRNEILIYGLEKGIAIDVLLKGDLYAFEDLNEKDLQYKVNPNRKKTDSKSTFPLLAVQSGENLLIHLPGSVGYIVIQSDQIDYLNKSRKEQYYFWAEGEWRVNAMGKPIDLGREAQKIVLN
jgi:hypothetical protein